MLKAASLLAFAALAAGPPGSAVPVVQVRATDAVYPCVAAAARTLPRPADVVVQLAGLRPGHGGDVVVGTDVELTRALESGAAEPGTERDLATIPWVLAVPAGNPDGVAGLADLARAGREVALPSWPAAYEARRALREAGVTRLRELQGLTLTAARPALVPLSLAGPGERIAVEVRPLRARAALTTADASAAARDFLAFLVSDAGLRAFVECGEKR